MHTRTCLKIQIQTRVTRRAPDHTRRAINISLILKDSNIHLVRKANRQCNRCNQCTRPRHHRVWMAPMRRTPRWTRFMISTTRCLTQIRLDWQRACTFRHSLRSKKVQWDNDTPIQKEGTRRMRLWGCTNNILCLHLPKPLEQLSSGTTSSRRGVRFDFTTPKKRWRFQKTRYPHRVRKGSRVWKEILFLICTSWCGHLVF